MAAVNYAELGQPRRAIAGLKESVAEEIRRAIFAGGLRPGSRIDQDSIAERLGVSKLPVREALIGLEVEGIVEIVPRRGAFVARLSRDDIRDHYWMLGVISGMAAERAASRISAASLAELAELADQMESGAANADEEKLNFQFHRLINKAAASRRLNSELKRLNGAIPLGFYESHPDWAQTGHRDHREILEALKGRSGSTARALTESHFLHGGNQAVAFLEARGFWEPVTGRD
ncbi:GntR family transcriptional regulator [Skermania sp. ID1734]|uniref:GntR family transcriptional regulator n=1 Tax=Skermania sp. ID1734 TaxID=2597516 RepID=UPI00117EA18C|nr:GntR family transcriptional regulator [Skermania sp. ID1734]TSD94115.1 GntR family transcriptional regulator [Skermania sp. ID1734]